jgi:oligopeptide/dipeptide ABC transporter ATP-binding protein
MTEEAHKSSDSRQGMSDDRSSALASRPLLELRNLRVRIPQRPGDIFAVRDVSFAIKAGERVVILGESGSGKTMTAMTMLGLQPDYADVSGSMLFQDVIVDLSSNDQVARVVRPGSGVVFQDSLSSLNPIARIGTQLVEALTLRKWPKRRAFAEAVRLLRHLGVPDSEARMQSYPHELSGGMRQRVMIAMALLAKPVLLVADEPTTALDTTVQAQVIDLIRSVQAETNMSLLLITHDLAMAAEVCDRAIIMYGGYVVENTTVADLLVAPKHPYSRALLDAMPRLDSPRDQRLDTIEGEPPSARETFTGCPFLPRCAFRDEPCHAGVPALESTGSGSLVRCVRHREIAPLMAATGATARRRAVS